MKMSQNAATPRRSLFLQVTFVLLSVCCLRPTLTLALSDANLQDSYTAPPTNNALQEGYACELCHSEPSRHRPITTSEEEDENESEVLTTEPPSPENPTGVSHKSNNNSTEETTTTTTSGRPLNGLEISVAVFFCIMAWWLASVILYTVITLFLLKLQSDGWLNIDDDDFGQVSCCCVKLRLAFLLRRLAVPLDSNGTSSPRSSFRRLVTRSERRSAMEVLFLQNQNSSDIVVVVAPAVVEQSEERACVLLHVEDEKNKSYEDDETHSIEEPACAICLGEYGADLAETIFTSTTCSHCFHKDCILDWLEQQDNTKCPCCRVPMVDNSKIYKQVKRLRKAKRKENETQNEYPGMLVRCLQCLIQQRRPDSSTSDEERPTDYSSSQTESPSLFEITDIEQSSLSVQDVATLDATDLVPAPSSEMEDAVEDIAISLQEQAEATQEEDTSPRSTPDLEYPILLAPQNGVDEDVELPGQQQA